MRSGFFNHFATRVLATLILWIYTADLRASDLVEVTSISDRMISLHFDDGSVIRHRLGQKVTDDKVVVSPLKTSSLDAAIFQLVTTEGSETSPKQLNRKSKGTEYASVGEGYVFDGPKGAGFFPKTPYSASEHWVYLTFDKPFTTNATYHIRWNREKLNTTIGETKFVFQPESLRSEAVHVNTLGYLPDAPEKFGYLYQWAGDAGAIDYTDSQDRPFRLVTATTGETQFTGKIKLRRDLGHQETAHGYTDPTTKKFKPHDFLRCSVWECDFSTFVEPGVYRLVVDHIGCSYPFRIANDVYVTPFQAAMRAIYQQRSGIELQLPFADGYRPAPHHPGKTPNFAGRLHYSSFRYMDMENEDLGSKADKAAIEAARKGKLDSTWGWYQDAGDWDGYIRHTMVPLKLLLLFSMLPDRFDDGQLQIPESGNGIPDILDEAAWLPRYFYRLRHELIKKGWGTGGVGGRVFPDAWGPDRPDNMANASWLDVKRDWYVTGEDPITTFRYAACAAQLAIHFRTLKVNDPEGVNWDEEAKSAYQWAATNSQAGDKVTMDRALAALSIYIMTGQPEFHKSFLQNTASIQPGTDSAQLHELEQLIAGIYLTRDSSLPGDNERETALRKCLTGQTLFVSRISAEKRAMRWAGNFWQPSGVGLLTTPMVDAEVIAAQVVRDSDAKLSLQLRSRILTTADFFLGCNALHTTWMTGIGPRPPRELFHLDDFAAGNPMRVGLTPYGPIAHDYNAFWFKWPLRVPTSPSWAFDTTYPPIESNPEAKTPTAPGTWPVGECSFDLATCPQLCEYTINQSLLGTAFTYGSLLPPIDDKSLRGWISWKRMHFSNQEILDGKSGPQAIPASDGIPNALKFVMGLSHPKRSLQMPSVHFETSDGAPYLQSLDGLGETICYELVPSRSNDYQWKIVKDTLFIRIHADAITVRIPITQKAKPITKKKRDTH